MGYLKGRVLRLEEKIAPELPTGAIRVIKRGELTADQQADIKAAQAAGKLIIIRDIIAPPMASVKA